MSLSLNINIDTKFFKGCSVPRALYDCSNILSEIDWNKIFQSCISWLLKWTQTLILFFVALPTDPLTQGTGRWETKHFIGMAFAGREDLGVKNV